MGFSRQEYWSGVPLPSQTGEIYFLTDLEAGSLRSRCWQGDFSEAFLLEDSHLLLQVLLLFGHQVMPDSLCLCGL